MLCKSTESIAASLLRDFLGAMAHPRTIQEIVDNFNRRKDSLRKALTEGAPQLEDTSHLPSHA